ncbi:MAG: diguanylate cyclase [Deltaproteobacteria bacterium]|nr:diguanylate cyclase [Deltaproteobacteria bacterium]
MAQPGQHLVLVAETSDATRAQLLSQLEAHGHRVAGAGDGEQALALVAREPPDVVLLDDDLAGLDGMTVLDRLRADPGLAAVAVIILTDSSDPQRLVGALRRGADDVLRRPVDPAELDARMMSALRVKGLHDALLEANRRLARQALTDDLTGLANRRHGGHQLGREIALCVRHGRLLALMHVDVDHFKAINDTHGHQAGDQVLIEVARRLLAGMRGGDELARWGGDEFVALLPDTDEAGALRAAERLRTAVAASPIEVAGTVLDVTVSVGWAHWSDDTPDDLLARADKALYMAKEAGRDQVFPAADGGCD